VLIFVDPFGYAGATVSGSSNWRALRKDRVAASGELGPVNHRLGFAAIAFLIAPEIAGAHYSPAVVEVSIRLGACGFGWGSKVFDARRSALE
jgi:hypothetical protein